MDWLDSPTHSSTIAQTADAIRRSRELLQLVLVSLDEDQAKVDKIYQHIEQVKRSLQALNAALYRERSAGE